MENAFEIATGRGTSPQTYLFSEIYIPRPKVNKEFYTEEDDPDNPGETIIVVPEELQGLDPNAYYIDANGNFVYKYVNVGMTPEQITDAYWTLYGYNMLSVPIKERTTGLTGDLTLGKKMNAIINMNQYKYLKWIDSMGYAYNPLWNVDGTDFFQYIDTHGDVKRSENPILQTNIMQSVTTDAQATLRPSESTSILYNNTTEEQVTGLTAITKEEHDNITDDSIGGTLKAITGGDYSHIEKRIRSGNIGVTQTSELIRNERELVRFNLVQEFFNDVNKQLLVGIYPGF